MSERDLVIRLIGDKTSLQRSVRSSSTDLKTLGVSAQSSARLQIEASLKKDARLRQEAAAYRASAAAAVRGSREQIVAANLAARADAKLARSLGVTAAESRAFARSTASAERDLGRATRGALAGSGIFRGLGRSIAFASGGFLAFASAGQFVRTSIDAAREAAVSQAQLAAQLKSSGKNFADYRGQIEKSNLALGALAGFQNDELDASFTTIFRSTRDVTKTLRDEALAADIARGRHISLAAASTIVAKVEAGNVGILRRAGLQISKNATVEQALATARARFAGQARAGTTAQERFGAVMHDTEEIIGAGLLPTLDRYLNKSTAWLSQTKNQEKIQRDVAASTKTVGEALQGVKAVLSPIVAGLRTLGKITGGTKNEVELLGTAFLLLKTRSSLIKWGIIAGGERQIGVAAGIAAGGVDGLTASFVGLFAQGSKLSGFLKVFASFGAELPALGDALAVLNGKNPFDNGQSKSGLSPAANSLIFGRNGQFSDKLLKLTKSNRDANLAAQFGDFTSAFDVISKTAQGKGLNKRKFEEFTKKLFAQDAAVAREALGRAVTEFDFSTIRPKAFTQPVRGLDVPSRFQPAAAALTGRKPISLQGRFNLDELKLANAELTKTSADNIRILRDEAAITREQIAGAKKLKDKTTLTRQLVGIMGQLKDASKAASDAFTLPQKFDLATARAAITVSTVDDLAAAQGKQTAISTAVNSGKLRGAKLIDALNQLAGVNDQIRSAQQQASQSILDRLQSRVDYAQETAGIRDDVKALTALRGELQRQAGAQKTNLDLQKQLRDVNTQIASTRQFGALGLDASGSPLTPATKALRRELGNVNSAIAGTFLDTSKTQSVLSKIRRVLSGGLGAVTKDVRAQIKGMLDDIDQQLKDHSGGPVTRAQKANSTAILARLNLNLTPDEVRRTRAELSQLTTRGTVPARSRPALQVGGRGGVVVHAHTYIDGKEIAPTVTKHQQKAARRNPGQRRGPHAGQ